jgi:hypothetical protein
MLIERLKSSLKHVRERLCGILRLGIGYITDNLEVVDLHPTNHLVSNPQTLAMKFNQALLALLALFSAGVMAASAQDTSQTPPINCKIICQECKKSNLPNLLIVCSRCCYKCATNIMVVPRMEGRLTQFVCGLPLFSRGSLNP